MLLFRGYYSVRGNTYLILERDSGYEIREEITRSVVADCLIDENEVYNFRQLQIQGDNMSLFVVAKLNDSDKWKLHFFDVVVPGFEAENNESNRELIKSLSGDLDDVRGYRISCHHENMLPLSRIGGQVSLKSVVLRTIESLKAQLDELKHHE